VVLEGDAEQAGRSCDTARAALVAVRAAHAAASDAAGRVDQQRGLLITARADARRAGRGHHEAANAG
jgi:hypothetical protein